MQVNQFIHYLDCSKELLDASGSEILTILKVNPLTVKQTQNSSKFKLPHLAQKSRTFL